MANTEFFDLFVETQKKMREAWDGYVQNVQAPKMPNGEFRELWETWYKKQQELFNDYTPATPTEVATKLPDLYRSMLEAQMAFIKGWGDASRSYLESLPVGDNQEKWTEFQKTQTELMETWTQQTNKLLMEQMKPFMPFASISGMENYSTAYREMFGYWDKIQELIKGGEGNIPNFMSPKSWTELMGNFTSFKMPEAMHQAAENAKTLFSNYNQWLLDQSTQFSEQGIRPFSVAGLDPWMNMFKDVQARLDKVYMPFNHMLNSGKQSEMISLLREAQQEYLNYAIKGTEFQLALMEAGRKAMPEVIEKFQEEYKNTQEMPNYEAFFQSFLDIVEKHLVELFETEEYAKLQNDLAIAGVGVKKRMDRFMELAFEGAPFTMKSESEELAKELQSLRRKIRDLEKRLGESQAAATTTKRSSSKAKTASTAKEKA